MFEFFLLCVRLAVFALPAVLFVAGCSEIAKFFHSWEKWRTAREQRKSDLYRVAEYVALHRERFCGCPNCGDSYSGYIESLNEGGDDVG